MYPKFRTNPVLKYTKCHISTNLSNFLKLCLLPILQKIICPCSNKRRFAEKNRLSGNTALPHKKSHYQLLKISDDIIACNLWFGAYPQSKVRATPMVTIVTYHWLVTSDVIGQLHVRLFFGLDLVLDVIRVGAKFRL